MKTLTLTYPHTSNKHAGNDYRVSQVEQDVGFKPGQFLDEAMVKDLCEMTGIWKVIIKHNKTGSAY